MPISITFNIWYYCMSHYHAIMVYFCDHNHNYSTVVVYIGINVKAWGLLSKNPTYKPAKHLLCDSTVSLFRHSQAQKCLQINSKPSCYESLKFLFNRFFYWLTDSLTISLMPSDKHNLITTETMGLISSPFNVASSQDMPFCKLQHLQCSHHGPTKAYLCSPFLSPLPRRWQFAVVPAGIAEVFNKLSFCLKFSVKC